MTLTNKEKQAAFKERMRSAGFIQMQVWVKKIQKDQVLKFIEKLNKE